MSYARKPLQILGGGWNILPPVDKVPVTDLLLAQNFRSDSLGRLVTRPGYPTIFDIGGAGIAHSASSGGGFGSPLYVGVNADLTPTSSSVYCNGVEIALGFDGNRIGFASQNGYMWIMNRGQQVRHSAGAGTEPWNLTAPPASPTVSVAGSFTVVANATFAIALTGNPNFLQYITIAGNSYSVLEGTLTAAQVAQTLATLAAMDPNCSVTYPGTGVILTVAPILQSTTITVSTPGITAVLSYNPPTDVPNGTYQYYVTFQSADETLESNPSPVAASITTTGPQSIAVTIPLTDAPTDARVGFVNIYRTGGTQLSAYRVGQVASTSSSPATAFLDNVPDLQATNDGLVMPTQNDPPPKASGIIGPFFSILFAWSTAAHKNRLFFTQPNLPQYWRGSNDEQVGDWVDVGADDEAIVWCTLHANLVVIYKERSIWIIIGSSPSTATLECIYDGLGLTGQFALAPAGQIDYFICPNGLALFDMSQVHVLSGNITPLFNQSITNAGPLTPPGSILPGTAFNSTSTAVYAIALGHAMGRLYISYAELGGTFNLLVFDEGPEPERNAYLAAQRSGRWFYSRNAVANTLGFFGFYFDGVSMIGLTGAPGEAAQGFGLSDFRSFLTSDPGAVPIEFVYGSHYEDCGLPENDKVWLEVAIDYECSGALSGGAAQVYAAFNAGNIGPVLLGTLVVGARSTATFMCKLLIGAKEDGYLARNMAIVIDGEVIGQFTLHNVYLYYYEEARLGLVASTLPTDLGVGKVKECKELELDINTYGQTVGAPILSDLPGNALAVRATAAPATTGGRAILKFPFATMTGLLYQVTLLGGPFRLYSVRLLMRVIGVFVEGYESTAGFVWDSMQIALANGEVATLDSLRFEMQMGGACTVQLFTDLPGEAFASRGVYSLGGAAAGRAWVKVPLPPGIEARSVQVQVIGNSGYRIYKAQVRSGNVGRYLTVTTPDLRQDAFNMSLEFDFATERRKMYKRLEIDLRADGNVGLEVLTDQDGAAIASVFNVVLMTPLGRQTLLIPLTPGIRGRLLRILLNGPSAARIYKIRAWARTVGDPKAAWGWEEVPLEASDVLPSWQDLIVQETSPEWTLVDVPFEVSDG